MLGGCIWRASGYGTIPPLPNHKKHQTALSDPISVHGKKLEKNPFSFHRKYLTSYSISL
jgi:hypothetical protein